MTLRAIIAFDTPDGLERIRIPRASLATIQQGLRQAAQGGGRYLHVNLINPATGCSVYRARARQVAPEPIDLFRND
jgi:hypothetical protein